MEYSGCLQLSCPAHCHIHTYLALSLLKHVLPGNAPSGRRQHFCTMHMHAAFQKLCDTNFACLWKEVSDREPPGRSRGRGGVHIPEDGAETAGEAQALLGSSLRPYRLGD